MQESVTYQLIKSEGREEGREEARQETLRQIVANLIREGMSADVIARITGLTIEQVQQFQALIAES